MYSQTKQIGLFPALMEQGETSLPHASTADDSTTFTPNQRLPIHRWFRYSAGFSGAWVADEIRERCIAGKSKVLDPFAGSGTTLIAAQLAGVDSVGVEAHPFVHRVSSAKLKWASDAGPFRELAGRILERASRFTPGKSRPPSILLDRIFEPVALDRLHCLSEALLTGETADSDAYDLAWLCLVSILRSCSMAGTAPWQYVLPNKRKMRVADPFVAFEAQAALMLADMRSARGEGFQESTAEILLGDARNLSAVQSSSIDLVLTSPPYPNNYDYADATRIEMTFLGEVSRWSELHDAVRKFLIPSCSQHTSAEEAGLDELLGDPYLLPIKPEIEAVCNALARLRSERAGKKSYDTMIAAYFAGMGRVWRALARVVKPGGLACFVIGDSAPYGVHVPVEDWLARQAEAAGFALLRFDETRQRNVKWKNRKHRVPLKEGRLWLERV